MIIATQVKNQLFSYTVNDHGHADPAAAAPAYQANTMFLKHKHEHEHQRRSVTLAVHGNVTHALKKKNDVFALCK